MRKIGLYYWVIAIIFYCLQCKKNQEKQKGVTFNLPIQPSIDSLLTKFTQHIPQKEDASVFVVIKNADANTLKVYLIAKKVQRSDFEIIGTPLFSQEKNGRMHHLYAGIERIIYPDTGFWRRHPEVFDDRRTQLQGLLEFPVIQKALYIFENHTLIGPLPLDDAIFTGNPADTLMFR